MTTDSTCKRLVVLAPNWLGDAVMALPAIADIRRHYPTAVLGVAARTSLAALFQAVRAIDEVIPLAGFGGIGQLSGWRADARRLAERTYTLAILLPNSFGSAWLARRAGIVERWGYGTDGRSRLLSRSVDKPAGSRHQVAYYQRLVGALGIPNGPVHSGLAVRPDDRSRADRLLADHGLAAGDRAIAIAPGAAYGYAKRWRPKAFAEVIAGLTETGTWCLLIGSRGDRESGDDVSSWLSVGARTRVVNLIGQTDLGLLMGVLSGSAALISNDSGAMHLATALGLPVTAIFGPTNEQETGPIEWADLPNRSSVLTSGVWCRPCMLRECPLDHRCMMEVGASAVLDAVRAQVAGLHDGRVP